MATDGYIGQGRLVVALALSFGAALAAVEVSWGPIIERNKENDARGRVPELVGGAAAELTPPGEDLVISDEWGTRGYRYYRAMRAGTGGPEQIGWAVKAKGPGYADNIEVVIGLDLAVERITGLYVLAQNETPGLGNKIGRAKWRAQFAGKSTRKPLRVVKDKPQADREIQAVSGATISSQSVSAIVNRTVADFRWKLSELPKAGP